MSVAGLLVLFFVIVPVALTVLGWVLMGIASLFGWRP